MEQQQQGFSDLTREIGYWQILKIVKKIYLCITLNIKTNWISTQKYGSGHFNPLEVAVN